MTTQPPDDYARYQAGPTSEQAQYQARPEQQGLSAQQPYPPAPYGQPQQFIHVQGRSAAVAVIASLFIPGLGSMLNEKVAKGILILACYIVAVVTIFFFIGFILAPAVWIWGMVAANNDAHAWNRAHGILS
jgi:TM2 domain-containing membrane protein YozV